MVSLQLKNMNDPKNSSNQSDIAAILKAWLPRVSPGYIQNRGWIEINRLHHDIAMSGRMYANKQYANTDQDAQREAFFDGISFGLLAQRHIADITYLSQMLATTTYTPYLEEDHQHINTPIQLSENDTEALTGDGLHDGDEFEPPAI